MDGCSSLIKWVHSSSLPPGRIRYGIEKEGQDIKRTSAGKGSKAEKIPRGTFIENMLHAPCEVDCRLKEGGVRTGWRKQKGQLKCKQVKLEQENKGGGKILTSCQRQAELVLLGASLLNMK